MTYRDDEVHGFLPFLAMLVAAYEAVLAGLALIMNLLTFKNKVGFFVWFIGFNSPLGIWIIDQLTAPPGPTSDFLE